jgi:hypothetical protein
MTTAASAYPVQVQLPAERAINRWWGLLWLGMILRAILVIPHMIVLYVLGILMFFGSLVLWLAILIFGKAPAWWCWLGTEFINRSLRVNAYTYLFPGAYPALGLHEQGPIDVTLDLGERKLNRLWGVPFFGGLVRFIVLIPQFIVLYALTILAGLTVFVVWIPILMNGRYPDLGMKIIGWYLRYSARVTAYMLFLPVPYPPIGDIQ